MNIPFQSGFSGGRVNEVAKDFETWANSLGELRDELTNILIVILVMAVIVLVIVQVLKSVFRVSVIACTIALWMNSLRRRARSTIKNYDELTRKDFFRPSNVVLLFLFPFRSEKRPLKLRFLAYAQSRPLLMRQVENLCRTSLENWESQRDLAILATAGAKQTDLVSYRLLAEISRESPDIDEQLNFKTDPESKSVEIAAARLSLALEANLDDLQLRLAQSWNVFVRFMSVAIGIGTGLALFNYLPFELANSWGLATILGLMAGMAATVIYDLLSQLVSRGRR